MIELQKTKLDTKLVYQINSNLFYSSQIMLKKTILTKCTYMVTEQKQMTIVKIQDKYKSDIISDVKLLGFFEPDLCSRR